MKRKLLPVVLASVMATPAFAEVADKKFYVGVNLATGSGTETATIDDVEYEEDFSAGSTRFALGYVSSPQGRIEVSYGGYSLDFDNADEDEEITSLDFDGYYLFGESDVRGFVTAGLGFTTYEDTAEYTLANEDLSGISFQFGGGVIFAPVDNIELEASLRIKAIGWQQIEVSNGFSSTDVQLATGLTLLGIGGKVLF